MTPPKSRTPERSARRAPELLDGFLAEALEGEAGSLDPVSRPLAEVAAVSPSPDLRRRLLDTIGRAHRFDDLEASVARLLDVGLETASEFLRSIDDAAASWDPGPRPGVTLLHLAGGPSVEDAVTGFVRVEVGKEFPEHAHVGDETVLVLQGAFEDSDGTIYRAGDEAKMPAGSSHRFRSLGPARLIGLAVVHGGVIVDGHTIGPGDPRA